MLNPLPELLNLVFFAPFFLRISLGMVLFFTSFHQLVDKRYESTNRFIAIWPKHGTTFLWIVGTAEIVLGLMLVAGIQTQIAAIVLAGISLLAIFSHNFHKATNRHITFYILMLGISLSLMVSGAGAFAFDTPL